MRELVLGGQQLAIGVENIGQGDHASLVRFLRGASRPLQYKPHVRPWLALSTPSTQCSTRSACNESRGVARNSLAQQKLPRCRLRVAVGDRACRSRGLA